MNFNIPTTGNAKSEIAANGGKHSCLDRCAISSWRKDSCLDRWCKQEYFPWQESEWLASETLEMPCERQRYKEKETAVASSLFFHNMEMDLGSVSEGRDGRPTA